MARCYFRARSVSQTPWMNFFAWVIAFWIASMLNASFDVALEGPMAGVPFWTMFGVGWGGYMVFNSQIKRPDNEPGGLR